MRRAALFALCLLGACSHTPAAPSCTTPIPTTTLYQVYCDVLQPQNLCLSPDYVDI